MGCPVSCNTSLISDPAPLETTQRSTQQKDISLTVQWNKPVCTIKYRGRVSDVIVSWKKSKSTGMSRSIAFTYMYFNPLLLTHVWTDAASVIRPFIFINWCTDIFSEDLGTEDEIKIKIKYTTST